MPTLYRVSTRIDEELMQRLKRVEAALSSRFPREDISVLIRAAIAAGICQLENEVSDLEEQKRLDTRIERITQYLKPRARVIVGREVTRADVVRAILERGAEMIEKQYCLDEREVGHVLVEDSSGMGGKQKRRVRRRRATRTTP
ncbi:MAG: hypothetical protein WC565_04225 [Parcubacteria group bacterium]|jgi:hypothetical protein